MRRVCVTRGGGSRMCADRTSPRSAASSPPRRRGDGRRPTARRPLGRPHGQGQPPPRRTGQPRRRRRRPSAEFSYRRRRMSWHAAAQNVLVRSTAKSPTSDLGRRPFATAIARRRGTSATGGLPRSRQKSHRMSWLAALRRAITIGLRERRDTGLHSRVAAISPIDTD